MVERIKIKEEPKDRHAGAAGTGKRGDLHEALEDSFPASDPPAMTQPIRPGTPDDRDKAGKS